ncbi:MAG: hypothetical protein HY652_10980, partial [Acidobacteria bacterium]|nr:hypothetical protein [Acidobacteriota bacterium]
MQRLQELARFYPTLKHLVVGLLILVAAWIAAKIFVRLLDLIFGRLAARTQSDLDDYLIAALRRPVTFLVLVAGAYVGFHTAGIQNRYLDGLLFSAGVMASVVALISSNRAFLRWSRERMGDREQALFSVEFLPLIEKVGFLLVLVIGLMVILNYFRI